MGCGSCGVVDRRRSRRAHVVAVVRDHVKRMRDAQWERRIRSLVEGDGGCTNSSQQSVFCLRASAVEAARFQLSGRAAGGMPRLRVPEHGSANHG